MIKKILSPLGLASLFVLGAPATAYSDSLPGTAATATPSQATCISYSPGSSAATNTGCGPVRVFVPLQSRTTGNFRYFATAPTGDFTQCQVFGKDFSNNALFNSAPTNLNGRTWLGNQTFFVGATTTLSIECTLNFNGRLQSVDSVQI